MTRACRAESGVARSRARGTRRRGARRGVVPRRRPPFVSPGRRRALTSLSGRPVVAFVGDSYSAGSEASSPDKRWTTVLSAERGWNEINVAVPGMGYDVGRPTQHYASQVARAAASKPGTVIISGRWNDVARGVPTATIVEGLRETLAAVKKRPRGARRRHRTDRTGEFSPTRPRTAARCRRTRGAQLRCDVAGSRLPAHRSP